MRKQTQQKQFQEEYIYKTPPFFCLTLRPENSSNGKGLGKNYVNFSFQLKHLKMILTVKKQDRKVDILYCYSF